MKKSLLIAPLFLLFAVQANALTSIEGKVHALDSSLGNIVIKENGTGALHVLQFGDDAAIRVNNKALESLSSLSVGEDVIYRKKGENNKSVKYISAKIQALDTENSEVTFVDTETGEVQTYAYDPKAVKAKNRRDIDVSRIRPGQKVELQVVTR